MTYSFQTILGRSASLVLLLLGSALQSIAQDAREQLTVVLSAPSKPGFLEVRAVNGNVHVSGYSGEEVVIDAASPTSTLGTASLSSASGLKRIPAGNTHRLTAQEKNNHVEISTKAWKGPLELTIKVPRNFSLKISTANNSDITIDNVAGEMELTNVNGFITLHQVAGSAVATTVNGNLTATFTRITAGAPMAFSTLNGKVDVTLPSNVNTTLKMKSDHGSVYSDFDVALTKGQPKATRPDQPGLPRPITDDWTYGKINNGGAEVMMQTFNGDIFLRKSR